MLLQSMIVLVILIPMMSGMSIGSPTPIPTAPVMCEWEGHRFPPGEQYKPNDCTFCQCTRSGRPTCAIADCFYTPCVDSVRKPGQCCNSCPNGNNCYAKGKKIIPAGKEVQIDEFTFCKCPSPWNRPLEATCVSRPHTVPARFTVTPRK